MMTSWCILLLVAVFLFGFFRHSHGNCIWYGECGYRDGNPDKKYNCPYSGPPKPFQTDPGRNKYAEICPDLYTGPNVKTCCEDKQVLTMADQLAVPRGILQRCPSCLHNFLNVWCYLACAPNQDEFLTINTTGTFTWPDSSTKPVVKSVNYFISEKSAEAMFQSCQRVQNPAINIPALSLMCGTTAEKCTAKSWLDFMGSTSNGQAPFDVYFNVNDTGVSINGTDIKPLEFKSFTCNQAPSAGTQPCSCQDCTLSCAPPPKPRAKPTRCHISGIDCSDFGFGLVYALFVLVFGSYTVYFLATRREGEDTYRCSTGKEASSSSGAIGRQSSSFDAHEESCWCNLCGAKMEVFLEKRFSQWGYLCARHPFSVISLALLIAGALCVGILLFSVTTDPVKLWSGPDSRARTEKDYFDSHFVPFYRTQQLIISRPQNKTVVTWRKLNYTNIFDKDFLHQLLDLQDAITGITASHNNKGVTLQDICLAPLKPINNNCTIQSVLNYFQNSHKMIDLEATDEYGWFVEANYLDHFEYCVLSPFSLNDTTRLHMPCLGTYGGPVFPWVAMGGFKDKEYRTSNAFVITIVVNNHLDPSLNEPAKAWESKFVEFMKHYTKEHPSINIAFSSERSIEDEIDRESRSDVITILASYLIMFTYVAVTLGQYTSLSRILVDAEVSLGLSGVTIALLSVGASIGFYSYLRIPSTLIIVEVVPFLVLAVGVDNIFILVQKYQRETCQDGETVEHRVSRVLGKVGPSMLLTSFSESLAFFLGALTEMPAVKVFSLYAAMAVLIDFLLQISLFIALLTLDAKRQEANRIDVLFCIRKPLTKREPQEGILYTLVSKYYSAILLNDWIRPFVMFVFVGWLCACGTLTTRVSIGLDQSLSMPKDSYVLDYFGNLSEFLSVGAPVYFVVEAGHDYSTYAGQNDICGVSGCPQNSLVQQINTAAMESSITYIAQPVTSWLDDYFSWLASPGCCRYDTSTGDFCPSTETKHSCAACPINFTEKGRPVEQTFHHYLPWFIDDIPGTSCPKGGHAAYGGGVQLFRDSQNETQVGASYFMTYHTILKTSEDYIEAMKSAREVSENITRTLNEIGHKYKVFPYSVFYVFYEQYLNIVIKAVLNVAYCLAAILFITFLLLGFDLHSAVIVVFTILMIVISILGLMYLWNIELNALSLVNLVMAIGISVEFCSHIVRAFAVSTRPTRTERAREALAHMGSSILSGITLTKIPGIIMLAFSKSQLFQVFYFRMYLAIVLFGALHGLIFLPVLLSYIGPAANKSKVHERKGGGSFHEPADVFQQQATIGMASNSEKRPVSYNSITRN